MNRVRTHVSVDELEAWAEVGASDTDLAAIQQAGGYATILGSEQARVDLHPILWRLLPERIDLLRCELTECGWSVRQPNGTLHFDVASRNLILRHSESVEGSVHYTVFDLTESESHQHHVPVLRIQDGMACTVAEFATRLHAELDVALCERATNSEHDWVRARTQLDAKPGWQGQFLVLSDNNRVYLPGRHPGPPLGYPDPSLEGALLMDVEQATEICIRLEARGLNMDPTRTSRPRCTPFPVQLHKPPLGIP